MDLAEQRDIDTEAHIKSWASISILFPLSSVPFFPTWEHFHNLKEEKLLF